MGGSGGGGGQTGTYIALKHRRTKEFVYPPDRPMPIKQDILFDMFSMVVLFGYFVLPILFVYELYLSYHSSNKVCRGHDSEVNAFFITKPQQ